MNEKPKQIIIEITGIKKKKMYEVYIEHTYRGFVIVDADNEEDAKAKGLKKFEGMDIKDIMKRSIPLSYHVDEVSPVSQDWKFEELKGASSETE